MSFSDAVRACFSKYATFGGRATRSEFWWFYVFTIIVSAVVDQTPRSGQVLPSGRIEVRHPLAEGVLEGSISTQFYTHPDQATGSHIQIDSAAGCRVRSHDDQMADGKGYGRQGNRRPQS